jgi:hypothetical protein
VNANARQGRNLVVRLEMLVASVEQDSAGPGSPFSSRLIGRRSFTPVAVISVSWPLRWNVGSEARRGAGGALSAHLSGWLDGEHPAIGGLI